MMMPFTCPIKCIRIPHTKKYKLDLHFLISGQKTHKEADRERVSSFITHHFRGSMTIETALVLPVFLFAMFLMISMSDAIGLYINLQGALDQNVKYAAQLSYDQRIDISAIQAGVLRDLDEDCMKHAPIQGGRDGIRFSSTRSNHPDVIDITAQYSLRFPFDLIGVGTFPMEQRSVAHKWVGYGSAFSEHTMAGEEEYVYITPHGTVYHRSADCSHIRLSIQEVAAGQLKGLRNTDGGKYKSCEICKGSLSSEHLYITEDGDRYHSSLICSGLKRDIITIPISEVGSRRACSRCGASNH